jgi:DNA-binding MarR family transcriptional regulator
MSKKRGDLKKLLKLVQYLSTELDPQMSILNLNAFLTTAVNEDVATMMDLRDQLDNYGGTRSNVSRNISYWADKQWRREDGTRPDGHGFVKSIPDPEDYRRRLLLLTQKGHAFCDELVNLLED